MSEVHEHARTIGQVNSLKPSWHLRDIGDSLDDCVSVNPSCHCSNSTQGVHDVEVSHERTVQQNAPEAFSLNNQLCTVEAGCCS